MRTCWRVVRETDKGRNGKYRCVIIIINNILLSSNDEKEISRNSNNTTLIDRVATRR